jgi:glutathione peroxidase
MKIVFLLNWLPRNNFLDRHAFPCCSFWCAVVCSSFVFGDCRIVCREVGLLPMAPKKEEPPPVVEEPAIVRSGNPIFDFVVKDMFGEEVPMLNYEGKVLLIVNVASLGTLTTQNYTELVELYTKYRNRDFEILAFPCNQFGNKEPNNLEAIHEWVTAKWPGAEFPFFDKVNVNGVHESPLWKYLKAQKGGGLLGDNIKWNFAKFLVDKVGNVVGRYGPTTPPSQIENDIAAIVSPEKPPTPPEDPADAKKKK